MILSVLIFPYSFNLTVAWVGLYQWVLVPQSMYEFPYQGVFNIALIYPLRKKTLSPHEMSSQGTLVLLIYL